VWKLREERPLSSAKIEERRVNLARKLKGTLNLRAFEELRPTLDPKDALRELEAARARDKDAVQKHYDELADKGAAFVAWVVPNKRCWPEQPSAWKRHAKWFAMWRSTPLVVSSFAFTPMKRSNSELSLQSWAAVSDVSWMEVESKASECGWQDVLAEQIPRLKAAQPMMHLSKGDIQEIKSLAKPPRGVQLTMEVICILLQVPPNILRDGSTDYWGPSKGLLADLGFFDRVQALVDYVPLSALDAAAPYMSLEEFKPEAIKQVAVSCEGLCIWAREVYKYHVLGQASAEAARRENASKAAGELLIAAEEAMEDITKADIQELKSLGKPPKEIAMVCSCLLHLFAGVAPEVELTKKGNVKDASWKSCQKFFSDPAATLRKLQALQEGIHKGRVPRRNVGRVRRIQVNMGIAFSAEAMRAKSAAAASLCKWLMSVVAYYDVSAPHRLEPTAAATGEDAGQHGALPASSVIASGLLDKRDLVELKSLAKPPQPVMIVCVCVCVLRPLGCEEVDAGWAGAKAMLGNPRLLQALLDYRKDEVTEEQRMKVQDLLNNEKQSFEGENMLQISKAAYGLLQWVRAIVDYEAPRSAD